MCATAQNRLSNRLLNVIKSLRQPPGLNLPQIQIKFNEKDHHQGPGFSTRKLKSSHDQCQRLHLSAAVMLWLAGARQNNFSVSDQLHVS